MISKSADPEIDQIAQGMKAKWQMCLDQMSRDNIEVLDISCRVNISGEVEWHVYVSAKYDARIAKSLSHSLSGSDFHMVFIEAVRRVIFDRTNAMKLIEAKGEE